MQVYTNPRTAGAATLKKIGLFASCLNEKQTCTHLHKKKNEKNHQTTLVVSRIDETCVTRWSPPRNHLGVLFGHSLIEVACGTLREEPAEPRAPHPFHPFLLFYQRPENYANVSYICLRNETQNWHLRSTRMYRFFFLFRSRKTHFCDEIVLLPRASLPITFTRFISCKCAYFPIYNMKNESMPFIKYR